MHSYSLPFGTYGLSIIVWLQFEGGLFDPQFGGLGGVGGWAHSVARPLVPISPPLTYVVYLVPFWSYFAGSKSVSALPPARPTRIQ